ncbi:multiple epidermal growth factor-like domains protein 10 isoform X2 [Penaeus japonicus]|uniref:multiple epidermal growth factor-like domains protein 10 isoform X2 n=1 Tax=Penaeus japonicus TaxID=27405 RepID=UPI001C70D936|nr:multiple epidermal growth factor-like domains protein 10 isoform X2 [Penaeus japonicus]
MKALVFLIFVSSAQAASTSQDRPSTAHGCPIDTPWGAGAFDDSHCTEFDASPCNGQGTCECGECICNERDDPKEIISGRFCECTNFLCDRHSGLLCSGPDHGECVCNKCSCKPGWTGEACDCEDSVENCKNPHTGEVCSNQGICNCNSCVCSVAGDGRYSGRWCEHCPGCRRREREQRRRERGRSKEERKQRRRERKQKHRNRDEGTTVSVDRQPTAQGCSMDTPWGPEAFDDSYCKETEESAPCSGRGTCICGECTCNERTDPEMVSGRFCECTNFLCDRYNGLLCSGPDHGECACNKCLCKAGWTGEACECEDSVDDCIDPGTGEICSGQGTCECNSCRCFESEEGRYSGKWCEDCPTCRGKCSQYKSCVQCQVFGTGDLNEEECSSTCTLFNATAWQVARVEHEGERLCSYFDENDCRFHFVYGYDEYRQPLVRVQRTLECPPSFDTGTGREGSRFTPWGPEAFDDSYCKETEESAPCSGRGTCVFGECTCNERTNPEEMISGRFCECTNFLCDRYNGLLCSGPDHGECMCNKCLCKAGWTGEACECEDSVDNCISPGTGEICSGQGTCECNSCRCFESEEGRYSGKWCEDCPTCRGKCSQYKSCVQCQVFGTGDLNEEECSSTCTLFNATAWQVARVEHEGERLCSYFDENDCRFHFVYGYDEYRQPLVRVQRTLECPPSFDTGTGGVKPERCFTAEEEPSSPSPCDQPTLRFHYVPERDRCEPVSACGRRAGTFSSPEECKRVCQAGAPSVSDASCNRAQCPWSRWAHYVAKRCQPLYDRGLCCPTRFSCPQETQLMHDPSRCYHRGNFYQHGDRVTLGNTCFDKCRCVVGVLPEIECSTNCHSLPQLEPGCRHLFNPGECCPYGQLCDESSPMHRRDTICYWGNKTYLEGDTMTFDDLPCQTCVCTSGFTNSTGYGCYRTDCGLERLISKLQSGCTPIYFEKKCCPTDFLCPGDPRISRSASERLLHDHAEIPSHSKCRLGDLIVDLGSKVMIRGRQMICRCITPPDLTCVQYKSRKEAKKHSKIRKDNCPETSCEPGCSMVFNKATRCSECSCTPNTLSCKETECPEGCRYDIDVNTGCPTCVDCL